MSQSIEQTTSLDSMSADQPDQPLERAVQATVDYLAWQADKAKIAELTEKVKDLEAQTVASKARKAQRYEEKKKRAEEFSEKLRSWDQAERKLLERDLNEAELETAEWKKKYQKRIDQEKMRAFGVSYALHEANEKLKENNVVIEHMKAELVKARNQAMGIINPPVAADSGIRPTSTTSHSRLLSGTALDSDSISASAVEETGGPDTSVAADSGVYPTSTMSASGLLSGAALDSTPLSGFATAHLAPSSGSETNQPPPISASATEATEEIDASYRILELELKLALTNHRLEQATSLAAAQKKNYVETAEKLHSAMSEIVTLRKRLDDLSSEIYLARAGQCNAAMKLWNEATKNRPMAIEISRTNHKLQSLLNETRKVLELVGDVLREPMKYAVPGTPPAPPPANFPPGRYLSISHVDLNGFFRLSQEREKFRGVVEEAEKYLRQVRMDALKWDSDHDETPEDEESEENVGEVTEVDQRAPRTGQVNGVPARGNPDADVSDFDLEESDEDGSMSIDDDSENTDEDIVQG